VTDDRLSNRQEHPIIKNQVIVFLAVSPFSHIPVRNVKRKIKAGTLHQSDLAPAFVVTQVFSHTGYDLSRLFLRISAKLSKFILEFALSTQMRQQFVLA
jgi:hypothetical protein